MRPPIDYTNRKNNMLTAIRFAGYGQRGNKRMTRLWLFQCDCGKQKEIPAEQVFNIPRKATKSCGCLTGPYFGLDSIKYRVFCDSYRETDGLSFEQFYKLSQEPCHYCGRYFSNRRYGKGKYAHLFFDFNGLDRIDSNKGHTLDNCRSCCWRHNFCKSDWDYADYLNDIIMQYKNLGLDRFSDGYIK